MEVKFIIIITVALFFIALVQLMKIYDLAAKVRGGKSQEKVSRSENMLIANLMLVFMFAFFGFIIWLILKSMEPILVCTQQQQNTGKK